MEIWATRNCDRVNWVATIPRCAQTDSVPVTFPYPIRGGKRNRYGLILKTVVRKRNRYGLIFKIVVRKRNRYGLILKIVVRKRNRYGLILKVVVRKRNRYGSI